MKQTPSAPAVSIVIPAWNEEEALPVTIDRIRRVIEADERLANRTEIVVVDDGSGDETGVAARKALDGYLPGTVVELAGNVGSHPAIRCGLRHARGDVIAILSADGQDPPESLPEMLDAVEQGAEVVWGQRSSRTGDPTSSRLLANAFYRVYRIVTGLAYPPSGLDFVVITRPVIDALERYRERNLPLFLLVYNLGYRQSVVEYARGSRSHGESGWSLRKRVKVAIDMLTAFSAAPLRMVSAFGVAFGLLGVAFGAFTLVRALFSDVPVPGWASLMVTTSLLGGMILLSISVLGEYVWRTLDEARARPIYLERSVTPIDSDRG
jgi:polyisoprenyl-phosphate glycosyltransferase